MHEMTENENELKTEDTQVSFSLILSFYILCLVFQ